VINLAKAISVEAKREEIGYWDFVRKYQDKLDLPFRVIRVEMAKEIAEQDKAKKERRRKNGKI